MPTLQELSAKVDDLQVSLDNEQQQVKDLLDAANATISGLNDTIAQLQASGGTDADRQAVADKLTALKTDLEGTVADTTTPPSDGGSGEETEG